MKLLDLLRVGLLGWTALRLYKGGQQTASGAVAYPGQVPSPSALSPSGAVSVGQIVAVPSGLRSRWGLPTTTSNQWEVAQIEQPQEGGAYRALLVSTDLDVSVGVPLQELAQAMTGGQTVENRQTLEGIGL